jgi:hypothetical protein
MICPTTAGLQPIYYLRDSKAVFMKTIKWIVGILVALVLLGYFVGMPYLREQTKKISPERTSTYVQNGFDLKVTYSSPSKKDRKIFGGLVPYEKVWRTGANEPTTFSTATDIKVGGQNLQKGSYSLWSIPGPNQWTVIVNSEIPDWGVTLSSMGRKTTRNPEKDVLQITVPVIHTEQLQEDLKIEFVSQEELLYLQLAWDDVQVRTPLNQ